MKKIYQLLIIIIFVSSGLKAQDIHFSQVMETPMALSPANTGFFNGYIRAIVNYRSQWASMNNAFQTQGISVDGGLFKSKKKAAFMGAGLTIYNDVAGAARVRKTSAMVNLSGLVKLGKKSAISVGLAGGTAASNGNYANLKYASQFNGNYIDPGINSGELPNRQFTTVDVSVGAAYEFTSFKKDQDHDDILNFKISFGAFHLNKPTQDYSAGANYRLPIKYVYAFTSAYDLEDTKFTITPTFVYQNQAGNNQQFMGSYLKYRMKSGTKVTGVKTQNAIGIGVFYRRRADVIPSFIFDIGDYSIAMAYDVNLSAYTQASKGFGGFEIALRFNSLASSLFESRKEFK
jgi:type IX secretion system PorP/SprF family membrane protein